MVAEPVRSSPLHAKFFSIYLDFARFAAAVVVVMGHMLQAGFDAPPFFQLGWAAHEAVIVFFVISGLVIAHSTFDKQRGPEVYAASRISRLYIVIVPALILSIILGSFVTAEGWNADAVWRTRWSAAHVAATLLFLTESWGNPFYMPFNPPFWSLAYEAWYYILFALAVFGRGPIKWPLLLLGAFVAGPAILLLAPAWLAGVWLYRRGEAYRVPAPVPMALMTFAGMVLLKASQIDNAVLPLLEARFGWWSSLGPARLAVTDLVLAFLFTVHLLAVRNVEWRAFRSTLERVERPVRWLAGGTFTLYLFHWPIVYFLSGDPYAALHGPAASVAVLVGVTLLCVLIGQYLEQNGTRWLRGLLLGARQGERQVQTG